ncbi:MAG TPA: hypothetical protein VFC86_13050 [Planctomycetota bacterium]|nr:hypothetical protein [Planctomycetota bacterium]
MRNAKTISISLEPAYERRLQTIAKRIGGTSAAVRHLLDAFDFLEKERAMEEDYRAFYSNPAAARESSEFNQAMLAHASWSPQGTGGRRGVRRRSSG